MLITAFAVAAAAAYLAWRGVRVWTRRGAGCGGCSCPKGSPAAPAERPAQVLIPELRLRVRGRDST